MSDTNQSLVVALTANANDDVSTVAFTVANAALSKGLNVAIFLSSDGVELAHAGACEYTHVPPFKKLNELIEGFVGWCRGHEEIDSLAGGVERNNPASARVLEKHGFQPVRGDGEITQQDRLFRLTL